MISRIVLPYNWIGHIPFAFYLINQLKPKVVVELGTHSGNSFCAFCQASKEFSSNTKVYAIDTWVGDEHAGNYDESVFSALKEYVDNNFSGIAYLIRKEFNEAVADFEDGTIDILHIDGLHTYEAVKNDFETWFPKLNDNSVVLFHDIDVKDNGFGVYKFWDELKNIYPNHFSFHHSFGLGVLINLKTGPNDFVKNLENDKFLVYLLRSFGNNIMEFHEVKDQLVNCGHRLKKIQNKNNSLRGMFKTIIKRIFLPFK